MRLVLLLASTARSSSGLDPNEVEVVTLLFSYSIRGAAFPVDKFGVACDAEEYNATPCKCFGGAARRHAFFEGARSNPNTVVIDTNSFFFGTGLFFSSFQPCN